MIPGHADPPRCFVGFFGLNRSLRWTGDSIRRNVIAPLAGAGFELTCVAHFNRPDFIYSPRAGEHMVPSTMDGVDTMNLRECWVEPQSEESVADLLPLVLRMPLQNEEDPHALIRRNILFQLHSLRRVGQLLDRCDPRSFRLFVLLRPDLEYIDPAPVAEILRLIEAGADLITPNWHLWGGLNDRFAFCSLKGARAYLGRWQWVTPFCREKPSIRSETLLRFVAERERLNLDQVAMRARRVRANGVTKDEDFEAGAA